MPSVVKPVRVALFLTLWLAPVWGATLELLSLNDLIGKSTIIVKGQVAGSSAALSGSVIYTHYQVTVLKQWKGGSQGTLDVRIPGGTANGIRQTYPGAPQLTAGRQYLLFLWTSSKGAISPLGFTQGVFNLVPDNTGNATASQMATTETVLTPGTGQVVNNQPISMPFTQLVSLISAGGTP
ncbi:MAG TPA: hypothetical protein VKR61_18605 [Bryobacteraceae bacterium]|nr:hypothetical protein [Bryobacteraceae bacterium]